MFSIFEKIKTLTATKSKQNSMQANELAVDCIDSRAAKFRCNPRTTATQLMALKDDHIDNQTRSALRRRKIVQEQLQKRGQILRDLYRDDPLEINEKEIEELAISWLKPSIEPAVLKTPAQIAAEIAARAAVTVAAKTHARLQALQAIDRQEISGISGISETSVTPTRTQTKTPKSSSTRLPRINIRDSVLVPPDMREIVNTAAKSAPIEYKARIKLSDTVKEVNIKAPKESVKEIESKKIENENEDEKGKRQESDTREKIEERFSYLNSPEHALKLIAQSVDTPATTLARLAGHENPHIRTAVARNQSTTSETLWILARDYEASIRYSLAENINTPLDILRALTKDRNQLVAWWLRIH